MSSVGLRRHAPFLVYVISAALLVWAIESRHYSQDTALALDIFGMTTLGMVILRNYTGPASLNAGLPKAVGFITAAALALAFLFLVVVVIIRIRQ